MQGKLRLISGLVLFVFVLGHFINHALGIVSLSAMNSGLKYTVEPWRTSIGTTIFVIALTIHVLLALWSLYSKRTLNMGRGEIVQILLGILIPIMLSAHVLSARGGYEVYGFEEGYAYQLYAQWIANPIYGFIDVAALLVVWIHACLGWHFWLRLKPWYIKIRLLAFSLALIIPVLAITGIVSGGFRVLRLSKSEKWVSRLLENVSKEGNAYIDFIYGNEDKIQLGVLAVIAVLLLIHVVRWLVSALPGGEKLQYRDFSFNSKREVKLRSETSVLDLLRQANIPHASVCGGRGRCSTCRVRVDKGLEDIAPPDANEERVLERIAAAPNVRLACQVKPKKTIAVTALLAPDATARDGFAVTRSHTGDDQEVAILFADIRAFTKLSEAQLPYDTAFLLNRYFAAMGKAIEESGGHLDKFIGDGVMAIFGIDKSLEEGSRDAIIAAKAMSERLEELNKTLTDDIAEPLRIGIGIHCGRAIVGNMGYNRAVSLTAIGDVVNTASRLEGLTKEFQVQLIVSKKAADLSGLNATGFPSHETSIRGRLDPLQIHTIKNASVLAIT